MTTPPHLSPGRFARGDVLDGRYEIQDVLGQGGMSEAYLARDRQGGHLVAIKVPFPGLLGDPATYSRFERELAIGRRLNHPHIQHLLGEGHLDGHGPYLVLEYVDGRLLREVLAADAPLPPARALAITRQLADALAYCHAQGIVHRDMKPENVLIDARDQVKLVDFGIALLRGARRLTFRRLSSEVGTPDYMAPEQVQGERGDARTDVYAVGVMLYEMLTGEVPYQGDSALAVMSQRVRSDAPLLRRRRPDLSPGLEAIVWRALRRDPAERYPSMAALLDDLAHPDVVPIPEYPPEGSAEAGDAASWLRSGLVAVGVLAALALLAVGAEALHRLQAGR